jgi:hypothetical protein
MTTATPDVTTLVDTLHDSLDRRWRRPDLGLEVSASDQRVVISVRPLKRPGYALRQHLPLSELRVLEREKGLDDLAAAILRSVDIFPRPSAA